MVLMSSLGVQAPCWAPVSTWHPYNCLLCNSQWFCLQRAFVLLGLGDGLKTMQVRSEVFCRLKPLKNLFSGKAMEMLWAESGHVKWAEKFTLILNMAALEWRNLPGIGHQSCSTEASKCAAYWGINATRFGQAKFRKPESQDPRLPLARKEVNASIIYKKCLWRICLCPPTGEKF